MNFWILIGLLASALARLIVPGGNPIRLVVTSVIGVIGAVLGGFLASAVWPLPERGALAPAEPIQCVIIPNLWELIEEALWPASQEGPGASELWPGWLTATTCAILLLRAYFKVAGRRQDRSTKVRMPHA